MKNLHFGFLLLTTYFNFTFVFSKIESIHYLCIYAIPALYMLIFWRETLNLVLCIKRSALVGILLCYVGCLAAAFVIPILYGTYDFSYVKTLLGILRQAIKSVFILLVFIQVHKKYATFDLFAKYFVLSCCVYVAFTVLFFLFPSLKAFWQSVIVQSKLDAQLIQQTSYVMRFGLIGFSGFQQTFLCSFAGALNVYLILKLDKQKRNWFFGALTLLILILGNSFYGRVGLLATLLICVYLLAALCSHRAINIIKVGSFIVFVSILILILSNIPQLNSWYNWAFAMFISFFETGKFSTGSSTLMFEQMYFLPSWKTIFIGDGYYTASNGNYYMHTDVGFMRPTLFYGIFFLILGYLIVLIMLWGMHQLFSKSNNHEGKWLTLIFLGIVIFFELKGEIFYRMAGILFPFYILQAYCQKKDTELIKMLVSVIGTVSRTHRGTSKEKKELIDASVRCNEYF